MKNCTPLWREAYLQVKTYKTPQLRITFKSCVGKKLHAVVARSTCPSQNVQSTPGSDHFWKLRCRKSARRFGAKHIRKSKCTKNTRFGPPILSVEMSKKCTPLWREAHVQVKMYKAHQGRTTFGSWDVETVHAVVARSTFRQLFDVRTSKKCTLLWREAQFQDKKWKNWPSRTTFGCSDGVLRGRRRHCAPGRKSAKRKTWMSCSSFTRLHDNRLHDTPLHYAPLHYTQLHNTTTTTTTTTTTRTTTTIRTTTTTTTTGITATATTTATTTTITIITNLVDKLTNFLTNVQTYSLSWPT